MQVIFIHLDLGIGGAEQLVLNLAKASLQEGHDVQLVTAHCRQSHCFAEVKRPDGVLSERVYIWGEWLPSQLLGQALCSTIRLFYLSFWTSRYFPKANVVVLDVLPTPIPLLLPYTSVLFYSHFPDKLLTRDSVNGEVVGEVQSASFFKRLYRSTLNTLEESTIKLADVLVVNSQFTREKVKQEFQALREREMYVLHPALNQTEFQPVNKEKDAPIVSLNRYERKKNIALLLQAYGLLKQNSSHKLPPLIVAGGYDTNNVENVEYLGELKELARQLEIDVTFLTSISDDERQSLLSRALCVVYTPHLEHFGIVPLESMAAGTPVVCVNSGGPKESVVHGKTGFLCENTAESFSEALQKLVESPTLTETMGRAAQAHVQKEFSQAKFQKEWLELLGKTVQVGQERRSLQNYSMYRVAWYLVEAIVVWIMVLLITYVLRAVGILGANEHILGSVKRALLKRDEL